VQKLSQALQGAAKRLAEMEQRHAERAAKAAAAAGMPSAENPGVRAYVAGAPGAGGGGAYALATPDGKVTVYSGDGKIMSVTTVTPPAQNNNGNFFSKPTAPAPMALPATPNSAAMPKGAPMPVAPPSPFQGGSGFGGQMQWSTGGSGSSRSSANGQPANADQRLQRLEAQMQELAQELKSLHKEMSKESKDKAKSERNSEPQAK
jgi:hypothetical protein